MKNLDAFWDALHPQVKPGLAPVLPWRELDPLPLPERCLLSLLSSGGLWGEEGGLPSPLGGRRGRRGARRQRGCLFILLNPAERACVGLFSPWSGITHCRSACHRGARLKGVPLPPVSAFDLEVWWRWILVTGPTAGAQRSAPCGRWELVRPCQLLTALVLLLLEQLLRAVCRKQNEEEPRAVSGQTPVGCGRSGWFLPGGPNSASG